jgi:hypothetical protein
MENSEKKEKGAAPIDATYLANKSTVQTYVNHITDLTMNPVTLCKADHDVEVEFNKNKQDAGSWNTFIAALNILPSTVRIDGMNVDNYISLLIQYANQIKNNEPYDVNAIVTNAKAITNAVTSINTAINTVLPKLSSFNVPLKNNCWYTFFYNLQLKEQGYYARNKKGKDLANIESWMNTYLSSIQPFSQPAPDSSQYLVTYWTNANQRFENWLKDYNFAALVQNPLSISTSVLDKAQSEWNNKVYAPFIQ